MKDRKSKQKNKSSPMRKLLTAFVVLLMISAVAQSQTTLFTYGKYPVTKEEFLKAFNKNPSLEPDRKKALKEYLELYQNFKLKVQAAYDAKLQEDPNYLLETQNFKKQLATNFINDEANIKSLIEEALQRSQKDIHLQQVFIPFPENKDTTTAYQQAQQAYFDLNSGKSFSTTASKYNSDQSMTELGYVTAFTLPYSFESVVYSLKPNKHSAPVRSAYGYHIFYNAGERPAVGRRKAAQILFSIPPGATEADKAAVKRKADSVYAVLLKSPEAFDEMVHEFSNDVTTAHDHGMMQEFGIGQFSPNFESAAFALTRVDEISKPVETSFGFHIIQLKEIIPIPKNLDDPIVAASFKERVEKDDRLSEARKLLVNKWMKLTNFTQAKYDEKELWAYTDSFYKGGNTKGFKKINDSTHIFSFAKQKMKAADFAAYVRASRAFPMYQSMSYPELMREYVKSATSDYYQNHLDDYNADFKAQLKEFNDANLLFAVMDKEVWTKAATDDQGLRATYEQNKSKYKWEASANAAIFTVTSDKVLADLQAKLKGNLSNWRSITESFGSSVMADSNRYELGQIPVVDRTNFTDGLTTAPVKNNDGSYTFAYIFKVYNEPGQRSFDEAKGLVINDYQNILEKQWLDTLRKKYPIKVNDAVFNSLK
jgi:peptidyl-prolyl cis-trans isomerase SurA